MRCLYMPCGCIKFDVKRKQIIIEALNSLIWDLETEAKEPILLDTNLVATDVWILEAKRLKKEFENSLFKKDYKVK